MLRTKACGGGSSRRTPTIRPALDSSGGRKSACAPSGQRSSCSIPRPREIIASWPNFRSRVLFAEAGGTASVDTNDLAALLRTQLFLRDPS